MTVDPERHLVFVPTGSASPDFYGGLRPGDDKWANSVVALRARTGEMVWGFQLVHHDLWDYDVASPPLLATLQHGDAKVPVVIAGDKSGFVYVLDRDTGVPVFAVHERSVPASDVPGEVASPTQPVPEAPPSLVPQQLGKVWAATAEEYEACWQRAAGHASGRGVHTAQHRGTVSIPGNIGGLNWSGYAFDPHRGLLIANTNNLPFEVRLVPRDTTGQQAQGTQERLSPHGEYGPQTGAPYGMFRRPLLSPGNRPCVAPPWGTLAAVDLVRGVIRLAGAVGYLQPGGTEWPTRHDQPRRPDRHRGRPGVRRGNRLRSSSARL